VNGRWKDVLSAQDSAEYEARAVAELGPDCARWLAHGGPVGAESAPLFADRASAPVLDVLGTRVAVLAAAATGSHAVTLQSGEAGQGAPLHRHDWDESFYVLSGEVVFTYAGESRLASAGSFVHVPAGSVHGFRYAGAAEMLEISGAGGRSVEMFAALDRELPQGPPDPAQIQALLGRYGVTLAG
jgi:quercetin dioxygenase-like cupin family protein